MNNIIANILRFLILLIVQVIVCQHICLFGYMTPALFLLALFLLPLELPLSLQYFIGFATGFVVDAFAHTLGVSSFACTLMMFVRPYVAHWLNGSNNVKFENIFLASTSLLVMTIRSTFSITNIDGLIMLIISA